MTPYRQAYLDYLASPAWQEMRRLRLEFDGYRCRDCGSQHRLEIHHLTYVHLGYEDIAEIITVCRSCHERRHLQRKGITCR
jgi:5-methylcytosine-specific restriction endonuclease McrA